MNTDKIRVCNPHKFPIGVSLQNGMERAILPRSFALLTRDDIEYIASMAPMLFEDGKLLRLEDRNLAVELGFIESVESPVLDEEEIRKRLNQRVAQVKAWLDGIQEAYLLDAICDVATQMDLPASKLQLLQELRHRTEWQDTPVELTEEDYLEIVRQAVRHLYVMTGRYAQYDDKADVALSADEYEYVLTAAEIGFYRRVQSDVNRIVGYSTDAMTITNADKPYANISQTITELLNRQRILYYKMTRFVLL